MGQGEWSCVNMSIVTNVCSPIDCPHRYISNVADLHRRVGSLISCKRWLTQFTVQLTGRVRGSVIKSLTCYKVRAVSAPSKRLSTDSELIQSITGPIEVNNSEVSALSHDWSV